jgi:ribonuclease VapC
VVIDTSAVLAILQNEPERDEFVLRIVEAPSAKLSAAGYVETGIVLGARYGQAGVHQLMLFITRAQIEVVPVDEEQAELAVDAYLRFGKGRHKAALNFGDCFAYALALQSAEKLLFKGTDFEATDL